MVDDSKTMRKILKSKLTELGYTEVEEACNGQDALMKVAAFKPELLLVDWNVPKMDGFTFVKTYREQGNKTPIIFVKLGTVTYFFNSRENPRRRARLEQTTHSGQYIDDCPECSLSSFRGPGAGGGTGSAFVIFAASSGRPRRRPFGGWRGMNIASWR